MSQLASHRPVVPAIRRETEQDVVLERVRDVLRDLRFGTVTIVVQDGIVIQIGRTEKHRFAASGLIGQKGPPPRIPKRPVAKRVLPVRMRFM